MPRALAPLLLVAVLAPGAPGADPPTIDRVEPPSWWTSLSGDSVMLLVEGSGLKGATVSADRPGVAVKGVECPGDGSALFVELALDPSVRPGAVRLAFEFGGARREWDWTVLNAPSRRPDPIGPDDVIYLVMPDRFANGDPMNDAAETTDRMLDRANPHAYHGGDFAGLKARLPYLKDLGVTAVWLTPVYKQAPSWFRSTVRGQARLYADFHGYSPVDFYDTNPRLGAKAEYRALVDEAHRLGMKVIQDQILGFTGPQHRWAKNSPTPGWFHGPLDRPRPCNFRFDALANPHAREADRRGMTDGWFFGILPDLNVRDPRVKRYAIQQSLWWAVAFEADAIRLDTYPMVDRAFWSDWSALHKLRQPGMRAIGEAWVNDSDVLSFFAGGRAGWDGIDPGVDTLFDFPLNFALVDVASHGAGAAKLGRALGKDFLFPRPDLLVTFLDNHDTPRLATAPNVTPARYRVAAAFLLTARGIPQLTWGDEIGLGGHSDDRRAIPGGWPGDPRDAFTRGGRTAEEQATFECVRTLVRLRRQRAALHRGSTTELAASGGAIAYLREAEDGRLLVVLNFGVEPATLRLPADAIPAGARAERLYGEGRIEGADAAIPAESAAIFRMHP